MKVKAPKGTKDMLPEAAYRWHHVEDIMKKVATEFGVREIRTPIFEDTQLFTRGVGETTDVVQKEMYTFNDKGNRSVTLKPEGTAGAVRAFVENSLYNEVQPTKMFYFTPVFRYEKMQKGRLREHHQFGVEIFGSYDASVDIEAIAIAIRTLKTLGIKNLELKINNIGCKKCRPSYNKALIEYFEKCEKELCSVCKERLYKNPLRILDCKNDRCKKISKNAPIILDYVCDDCKSHFALVKEYLKDLHINFEVDPYIVRGLDYYTTLVFEIINKDYTVCGGGRYNSLIKEIGGPDMGAVGFGMGMERILLTLEEEDILIKEKPYIDIYIGSLAKDSKKKSLNLANKLREIGIKCEIDHLGKSVKAQMKYANKINARYSVILGEDELKTGIINLKEMEKGSNIEVSLEDFKSIREIVMNDRIS